MREKPKKLDILDRLLSMGTEVNGLIVPAKSLEDSLVRHACNLVVVNDNETYKVSLVGSATALRYRGRYLLLCTQHQLRGILDTSKVALMADDGSICVTSSGMRHYGPRVDTDAYDIVAFDFTEPVQAHPQFKGRFFDFRHVPPDTRNIDIVGFVLAGFPSLDQQYELHERNHIGLARRRVICVPDSQPSDPAILTLRNTGTLDSAPDGMSGGPAFVVHMADGEFAAYFAGIIVRGGTDHFHILKAGFVHGFLDSVMAHPT